MAGRRLAFHYTPLEDPTSQIRLVHLLPSWRYGSPIQCTIDNQVAIQDPPAYKALSYVWGSSWPLEQIIVDGSVLEVTANLELALRHLRQRKDCSVLWIDALCIDQTSNVEKSHQVSLMGGIYARAEQVLVWLGIAGKDSIITFQYTKLAAKRWRASQRHQSTMAVQKVFEPRAALSSLLAFLSRPYWTRLWICQELLLSNEAVFLCGHSTLDCFDFATICDALELRPARTRELRNSYTGLTLAMPRQAGHLVMRYKLKKPGLESSIGDYMRTPLLEAIIGLSDGGCADPRDKIFGLLGIVDSNDDALVALNAPDYSLTTHQIYIRLVKTYITMKKNLDILSCCTEGEKVKPSWVPRWDRKILDPLIRHSITTGLPTYNACAGAAPNVDFDTPDILRMEGFTLTKIQRCGAIISIDYIDRWNSLNTWSFVAKKGGWDVNNLRFWVTLTAGLLPSGKRMQATELEDFYIPGVTRWLQERRFSAEPLLAGWKLQDLIAHSIDRQVCLSDSGKMCLAPAFAVEGDSVCVFFGAQTPFIVRETTPGHFMLLGEVYVEGAMDGEAMADLGRGDYRRTWFTFV